MEYELITDEETYSSGKIIQVELTVVNNNNLDLTILGWNVNQTVQVYPNNSSQLVFGR